MMSESRNKDSGEHVEHEPVPNNHPPLNMLSLLYFPESPRPEPVSLAIQYTVQGCILYLNLKPKKILAVIFVVNIMLIIAL